MKIAKYKVAKYWLLFENGRKFISEHFDGIWKPTINQNRYRNLRIERASKMWF